MMRLEWAAHLPAGQAGTVSEIAYAVGFKSMSYFSGSFVQAYGCRPSAYASRRYCEERAEEACRSYAEVAISSVHVICDVRGRGGDVGGTAE